MKLTKKSDYGLRLMSFLASHINEGPIATPKIAEAEDIPVKFLSSVVQSLRSAHLLESIPGAKGGIRLAKDPKHISALAVIEAVEGQLALMECMEESSSCGAFHHCRIHSLFGRAQLAMNEVLQSTSISDLVDCPISN